MGNSKIDSITATVRYTLRVPSGARKAYSIVRDISGSKREQTTLKIPELDEINKKLKKGHIAADQAGELVQAIVKQLRDKRDFNPGSTGINKSQVEQFKEYLRSRVLKGNKRARERSLQGAFALINHIENILKDDSILTIDVIELKSRLDNYDKIESIAKLCVFINLFLKFVSRTEKIIVKEYKKDKDGVVISISEQEFLKKCELLPEGIKNACRIAYYTGMRLSEVYAIGQGNEVKENVFSVNWQIDRDGEKRKPKGNKIRVTICPDFLSEDIEKWILLKSSTQRRQLQDLCKHVLKVNFHALRHSFAKNLINKNVSIITVAQLLGDDPQTVTNHQADTTFRLIFPT